MADMTHTIKASDVMSKMTLTVRVNGIATMKARAWLGANVMRLGAAIIGCPATVTMGRG
jgi:hypothetical protein